MPKSPHTIKEGSTTSSHPIFTPTLYPLDLLRRSAIAVNHRGGLHLHPIDVFPSPSVPRRWDLDEERQNEDGQLDGYRPLEKPPRFGLTEMLEMVFPAPDSHRDACDAHDH